MSALSQKCLRALIFDEEEEYHSAIEEMTLLIQSHSSLVIAHNNRGVAYLEIGRTAEAERDLRLACDLSDKKDSTPLLNLAGLLQKRGALKEALAAADAAVGANDGNSSAQVVRDQIRAQYEVGA